MESLGITWSLGFLFLRVYSRSHMYLVLSKTLSYTYYANAYDNNKSYISYCLASVPNQYIKKLSHAYRVYYKSYFLLANRITTAS